MSCLNCGASNTIDAHLIPKAFVAEVKSGSGEQHLLIHAGRERPVVSNTGVYDRDLLCGDCDSLLGAHEGYVIEALRRFRAIAASPGRIVPVDPIDGDRVVRFAAGIAWKYANTRPGYGRIEVGPYADRLGDVALRNSAIPASIDVAMIRLVELDGDVYFYRAPVPDRREGANMVRFTVGSFLFFLKIDQRLNGSILPPECWLHGRARGAFLAAPADVFEEGRMHRSLGSSAPARRFFGEMRARKGERA